MMFAPFCPTHHSTVLMTRRNVMNFWNGPDGPVIHWKCSCGHEGLTGRTGDDALDGTNDADDSNADLAARSQPTACVRACSGPAIRV